MSSFVRKGAFGASPADLGTRAGLHSQTLISTGLADLDRILGGGLPLGAILVLFEDAYSPHGSTLLRYFAAEGVVCGHRVHWAGAAVPEPKSLPSLAKSRSHSQQDDQEPGKQEDPKLRIAWQYRRYIKRQHDASDQQGPPPTTPLRRRGVPDVPSNAADVTSPSTSTSMGVSAGGQTTMKPKSSSGMRDWSHQFDLTRPMDESHLQTNLLTCQGYRGSDALGRLVAGVQAFTGTLEKPAQPLNTKPNMSRGPESIGRVAIEGLGCTSWQLGMDSQHAMDDVLRTVLQIKALVRAAKCAACISIPAGVLQDSALVRLQYMCDAVIVLEAFREDSGIARLVSDASSCCGLLRVRRLPALNTLSRPLPSSELYLLRHRRRRLAIEQLQVDPDAEAAEAEHASGKSSAAGLLCSGPPAAAKILDF
ncbi:Elongator complex protein 4 [Coccomyxa sp. Obi]|nr:Elongator complex protein 4 [Coccomyxa sp. Obi]